MAARSARIDAARGCAVFGILLVNIWGFVHGYALQRYTDLAGAMPLADQAVLFFVTAFAEQKFYPIFSFLFGAGFVLQTGRRRAPGPALDAIRAKYLRRVRWLLACGVVHGAFFWFGDILTTYALLGFWLVQFAGVRLASLWRTLWLLVALNGAILIVYAVAVVATPAPSLDDAISMAYETQRIHAVYTQGGWLAIARERLSDYATNLAAGWIIWPRIALLFMLGVIAARMGCLTRPQRMRRFWRTLAILALVVGLPLNLWAGAAAVSAAMQPFAALPLTALGPLVQELAGPLLGGGYLAAFMLARRTLAAWLVPVGRMALTNYLMQSLIAMLTLQGFALGLGKTLGALHLMLLAFAIMAAQTLFSHWWMAHHPQGPMETWWRRYTDGKPRV
ncbi:DUF418 domain-containing protein [Massilia sp. CF038]|uniref:DUF418 domain-containing protein n=1 Tax=Massilia sp. CF038 TaxID=1881045 RepID=UPI000923CD3D|nr:DUF418 domain-containing protein [Massilia sp. CF038]SHG74551.1 uncharacterized protein SAMN05428948_1860 [Massilia sp. CF038]